MRQTIWNKNRTKIARNAKGSLGLCRHVKRLPLIGARGSAAPFFGQNFIQNYCKAIAPFCFALNAPALGACIIIGGSAVPATAKAVAPSFQVTVMTSTASVQVKQTEEITAAVTASNTSDNYSIIFAVTLNGKQVSSKGVNDLNFSANTKLMETYSWPIPATTTLGTYKVTVDVKKGRNVYGTATTAFAVIGDGVKTLANGTTIPPAASIVDNGGYVCTVSGGVICQNGHLARCSANVIELTSIGGFSYQENNTGSWSGWTNGERNLTNSQPASCASTSSDSTMTKTVGTAAGTITATTARCPYGSAQPITARVTKAYHGTSGTLSAQCGMPLVGVNIDGGELNSSDAVDTLHTDYIYPSKAEIDYYASKGLKIIRVPFELSRLQPTPAAPLDSTTLRYLTQIVSWAAADRVTVLLDPHDYGYAWGHLIGTNAGDTTNAQFANFWSGVAGAFKYYPNVAFGIMNEPHVQPAAEWAVSVNAAIAAIRQRGATQEIMVPGVDYTNAGNWIASGSAAAINPSTIIDPGHNYVFEVHEYLDPNSSGTTFAPITDPNLGVKRLTAVTQWAYSTGAKLFLGEFGVPPDNDSRLALRNTLTYMRRNAGVWQGIAYFSGGPWWPATYPFSVEPTGLGTGTVSDAPQMGVLDQFSPTCTLSSPP